METHVPKPLPVVTSCLLALATVGVARAEDIPANLRIDRVTVYARSAAIVRQGDVRLPAPGRLPPQVAGSASASCPFAGGCRMDMPFVRRLMSA